MTGQPTQPSDTAEDRHAWRELGPDEPAEPTEAWIEHADGSRTDLVLMRTGRKTWTATPAEPVTVDAGTHLRVDRLPVHHTVAFLDVLAPQGADTPE